MNRREQQKTKTVSEILRVSHELFSRQGFNKTTIQQIADTCGLSKGAMYHHFNSKEAVLDEICRREYLQMVDQFSPIRDNSELAGLAKLELFMATIRESSMNTSSYSYAAGSGEIENALMEKTLDVYSRKIYGEIIGPILEEARALGECEFPGSAESMALYLHGLDNSITEQINQAMNEGVDETLLSRLEGILESFIHILAQILGIPPKRVEELLHADTLRASLASVAAEG